MGSVFLNEGVHWFGLSRLPLKPETPMQIQVNSDKTIDVDASLIELVEDEVSLALDRFAAKLTRVEVHLSDVDNKKTGRADKRCLIEVRPAGDQPRSTSAIASATESAVRDALRKMQRALTTFFGRKGRATKDISAPAGKSRKSASGKTVLATKRKRATKKAAKKTAVAKSSKLSPRGPKKKGIYQARRKSWPK